MFSGALLAVICLGCVVAAIELSRADWPWRGPRTAILLWQAIGLAWGIAAIGTLLDVGLAPYGKGAAWGLLNFLFDAATGRPTARVDATHIGVICAGLVLSAALLWVLAASTVSTLRARNRHRTLLSLVARGDPDVPGALVLDHPAATAYCVPGMRSQVVISAGALRLLDRAELAAVLAHERAHLRWRHDLVLLPFSALRRVFPYSRVVSRSISSVGLLVEMSADDGARGARRALATALLRIGTAGVGTATPTGALAAADGMVSARVSRLLRPVPTLPQRTRLTVLVIAVALVTVPFVLLWVPF